MAQSSQSVEPPQKPGRFSARIYWESKNLDKEVEKEIARLIDDAEKATESLCMVCGAPAEIKQYGNWFACLCEVHGRERLQKKSPEGPL